MRARIRHRATPGVILAVLVAVPVAALAAAPSRPAAGKWKVKSLFGETKGGGFSVSKDQRTVSSFQLKTGSVSTVCPKGTLTVSNRLSLTTASRGGVTLWIVGRNTPKKGDGISPIPVKVNNGATPLHGATFKLAFQSSKSGNGELDLPAGCTISFNIAH
jgi:hypothetical protein